MTTDKSTGSRHIEEELSEEELCPSYLLTGQEKAFEQDIKRLQQRKPEFVEVICPACDSTASRYSFSKHDFAYRTCDRCKTLFMSPRPSPAVMESYYSNSENYQYWAKYIYPTTEESRREKLHKPWFQRVVDYCERYQIRQKRLIEIGAGFGTFCEVAQESGKFEDVVVIEPTPEMAEACRARGLTVIEKRIEDISDEITSANVVVAFEVIEHLFEPKKFVRQSARLLDPGGLLVLSCPNGQGFDIATLRAESLAIDPEHVNLFNPQSLQDLVTSCGFDVMEISTPGRLDAEFVHEAIAKGQFDVTDVPFLKRVLVDEWDRLGWPFQKFLAEHGLSSHMWLAARKEQI